MYKIVQFNFNKRIICAIYKGIADIIEYRVQFIE